MPENKPILDLLDQIVALSPSGCAIALHIRFTAPEFLYQTYPPDWIATYSERGYVMHDPTVRWGFDNTGHVKWCDLTQQDEQGIFTESARFGLSHGVSIATDSGGSRSFASFANSTQEFTDAEIEQLAGLVEQLHLATIEPKAMKTALRDALHKHAIAHSRPPVT